MNRDFKPGLRKYTHGEPLATAGRWGEVSLLVRTLLLTAPALIPVQKPRLFRHQLQEPFQARVGHILLYSWDSILHNISPDGALSGFGKLAMRWFLALTLVAVVFGIPALLAASFMEQGAILLHSAFKNLFYAVLYLIATLIILAIAAAILVGVSKK